MEEEDLGGATESSEGSSGSGGLMGSGITDLASTAVNQFLTAGIQNWFNQRAQNKQNAYNTPAAQMARFQAAGLNPNLIYGQGTAGNQSQPVQFSAPVIDTQEIVRKHLANVLLRKQQKSMDIEAAATRAKTQESKENVPLIQQNVIGVREKAALDSMEQLRKTMEFQRMDAEKPYWVPQQEAALAASKVSTDAARAQIVHTMSQTSTEAFNRTNLALDAELKKEVKVQQHLDNELRKRGAQPHDNAAFRNFFPAIRTVYDSLAAHEFRGRDFKRTYKPQYGGDRKTVYPLFRDGN